MEEDTKKARQVDAPQPIKISLYANAKNIVELDALELQQLCENLLHLCPAWVNGRFVPLFAEHPLTSHSLLPQPLGAPSQNCSGCGKVVKTLSVRTHLCPHCGHTADRDFNAAINILRLGLNTVGHTGISTLGEMVLQQSAPART